VKKKYQKEMHTYQNCGKLNVCRGPARFSFFTCTEAELEVVLLLLRPPPGAAAVEEEEETTTKSVVLRRRGARFPWPSLDIDLVRFDSRESRLLVTGRVETEKIGGGRAAAGDERRRTCSCMGCCCLTQAAVVVVVRLWEAPAPAVRAAVEAEVRPDEDGQGTRRGMTHPVPDIEDRSDWTMIGDSPNGAGSEKG
jgi:hypothetical protein